MRLTKEDRVLLRDAIKTEIEQISDRRSRRVQYDLPHEQLQELRKEDDTRADKLRDLRDRLAAAKR